MGMTNGWLIFECTASPVIGEIWHTLQRLFTAIGAAILSGTVSTHVYQGSHVDVLVDVAGARGGRVTVRVPGHDAPIRWPAGSRVALDFAAGDAVAFACDAP